MDGAARRFAMVAGEASGDLLAGLLLDGMRARWPRLASRGHRRARRWRARGFEAWWPHEKLAVQRLRRGAAPLPRDRRHPRPAQAAPARASRPTSSSASTRPTSTWTWKPALKARGIRTVHFVCPSIWAWRAGARREDPAQRRPCAVHLSLRARAAGAARHRVDLRRPSAGERDPDGAGQGRGARARWA